MAHPMTVLVLTPSIGGYYFGEVLAGLTREVASAGGRLVIVQTLDADARGSGPDAAADFGTAIAWSQVDGVVAIAKAVRGSYLQRLRDAGKPVVLTSTEIPDFDAPVALPDNHGGTFAAIEHLIGHAHTRIGFVGNLAQPDTAERYAAYLEALEIHDLVADPTLVFATPENSERAGVRAAHDVLTTPRPPSALMVATDRTAIGLMRALTDAGLDIPHDIAVVAFDNTEAAAFNTPTLSSVNQRFDEVGALAGRLVLAQIRGENVPHTAFTSQSVVVAVRESCGCATDALELQGHDPSLEPPPELLRDELRDELSGALLTGDCVVDGPLRDALLATVHEAEALLRAGDDVTTAQIRVLTTSLRRLTGRPDVLRRITGAMTEYVQRSATSVARARDNGTTIAGPARVVAALWQLQAGALLRQSESGGTALEEQYLVDAGLLDPRHGDPSRLDWLAGSHVRVGALALWQDGPSSGLLRVVGTYDPDDVLPSLIGTRRTPERFPPVSLITAARAADRGVCVVVPVRTQDRDWGLLAVVGEIDTTSARETYHHWAALLCASLESARLQEAVRESEERYALASRATHDGQWEWNTRRGTLFLSDRSCTLLGLEPDPDPRADRQPEWEALIHPDDLTQIERSLRTAADDPSETVDCEFRAQIPDGSYRWMLTRAVGVPSAHGAVERVVGSLTDIHERRSLEHQLRENALYDSLTGLPNRRLFLDRLEHSLALWHRSATPFAVIFLDLDGFKAINDSLGHQMGDSVLREVGTRIADALRTVDTGARFGGDEFAILLHDVESADVMMVVQRVQAGFLAPLVLDGHEIAIRASLGVATSQVEYNCAEDVLRDADAAMYRAKTVGRGSVSFFDAAMHTHTMAQQRLHVAVQRALQDDQFEMHYQPIVNLGTGRTDRFEALVRWRHPTQGLLGPDHFLTLMEEMGLIVRLGHWIMDEVCRQLAAWGPEVISVSINLSDREFWHPDLLANLLAALERHHITSDRLTLEITEGVIMRRPDAALVLMRDLHDAGFRLELDDFGTGYSSLETLHRFPVDAFKIDRSFIRGLASGGRSAELVSALVAIGKALDLAVVAEGVETDEQLAILKTTGCATGQGFLFMPAITGAHARGLLSRELGNDPKTVAM